MALEHPLRTARRDAGWSRAELSRRAGVSAQAIYLIESGRVITPNVDTALGLAEALGRPAELLFGANGSSASLEDSRGAASGVAPISGIEDDATVRASVTAKDSELEAAS